MKIAQYILLVLLSVNLIWRGIIPALTKVDTDFPNYYTSAKLLAQGKNLDRLYDDDWFQTQIRAYGMDQWGKFSPYPPITAIVMLPLVSFPPLTALRVWTAINLCVLFAVILLLSKIHSRGFLFSTLMVLLSGNALVNNFRFGQFYLVLTLLLIVGYRAWMNRHERSAGIFFGMGAAVKYFPILFFPLFLSRREWKAAVSTVLTVVLIWVGGLMFVGRQVYGEFFSGVLGRHLAGNIQNPFVATFQSWNSLFRRWFIFDASLNPHPLHNSPLLYSGLLALVFLTVAGIVVVGMRKSQQRLGEGAREVQFSLLCIAGLLLLPASGTYHFLLLIVPVVLILKESPWTQTEWIVVACFALIGFVPYRYTSWFDGKGIQTILAYPRLILTALIFGATSILAIRGRVTELVSQVHHSAIAHDYSS